MAAAADADELAVFAAEKYFSGGMDGDEAVAELETPWKTSSTGPPRAARSAGPPSMCSETSGNSHGALPRDSRRRSPTGLRRPRQGSRKFLGIFPCCCSDKTAVEVDKVGEGPGSGDRGNYNPAGRPDLGAPRKQPAPDHQLRCDQEELRRMPTDGTAGGAAGFHTKTNFTLPPVSKAVAAPTNSTVGIKAFKLEDHNKLSRISPLEVLGNSPAAALVGKESEVSASIRRISLTIVSPHSRRTTVGGAAAAAAKEDHGDAFSESSSELFEIESFFTGTVPVGGGPGGTSASTTGYEPSEASIEWSVVTASAANFSAHSDGEGSPPSKGRSSSGNNKQQNQRQLPGGGLLLGCGSAKAVNVVPSKHHGAREKMEATTPDRIRRRSESAGSAAADLESGRAGHVAAARGFRH